MHLKSSDAEPWAKGLSDAVGLVGAEYIAGVGKEKIVLGFLGAW